MIRSNTLNQDSNLKSTKGSAGKIKVEGSVGRKGVAVLD